MEIIDIKLKYYLRKKNTRQFDIWFELVEASEFLKLRKSKGLNDWTFDEVVYLRQIMSEFNIEAIQKVYDICFEEKKILKLFKQKVNVLNLWTFELIAWWKWVIEELEKVNGYERNLESDTDVIAIQAGIDAMGKFGFLNTKIPLAERLGVLPDDVGRWKWTQVYLYSFYYKTKNDIDIKYAELKAKQK